MSARLTVAVTFHRPGDEAAATVGSLRFSRDPRVRLLLVDDGSPGDGPDRVGAWADELGAEALLLPRNVGVAAARNAALRQMDTDWLTFLDGDDWVGRGYYPRLLEEVERVGADWVRTDHVECTGRQRVLVRIPTSLRDGRVGSPREAIAEAKTSSVDFAHSWSGVYRRRLRDEGLLWFPEELATAEDRPWIWRLHLQGPPTTVARTVGVHYRRGLPDSLTQTADARQLAVIESMRQVRAVVEADPEAARFLPKVMRTWTGLLAWHWEHRGRLAPGLRRRFVREAAGLLDTAPPDLLADAIAQMPESRRQMIGALRRSGALAAARPAGVGVGA